MKKTMAAKAKKRGLEIVGAPAPADDWQALFFDLDEDGGYDEDTVFTVRVACWANVEGRLVGLIPHPDGLKPAEIEDNFRGYVDGRIKDSVGAACEGWDEEETSAEDDDPVEGD
jgi:hypothetical protein